MNTLFYALICIDAILLVCMHIYNKDKENANKEKLLDECRLKESNRAYEIRMRELDIQRYKAEREYAISVQKINKEITDEKNLELVKKTIRENEERENILSKSYDVEKEALTNINSLISTNVEVRLRRKYFNDVLKPSETSIDAYTCPTVSEATAEAELWAVQFVSTISPVFKVVLSKYYTTSAYNKLIKDMYIIYYSSTVNTMRQQKLKIANKENTSSNGVRVTMFRNNALTKQAIDILTPKQTELINKLKIKSVKDLQNSITIIQSQKSSPYYGISEIDLTKFN